MDVLKEFNKYLDKNINFNRVNHFYLIETNHSDKLQIGKELVRRILFENYKKYSLEELFLEEYVLILDNEGSMIKVEDIEKIKEKVSKKSLDNKPYIYIINDCENMNNSSVNKMLKFLEEPGENIYAIMITSNRNALTSTLVSRCQTIRFHVDNNEFTNQKNEYIDFLVKFVSSVEEFKEETIAHLNKDFYETIIDRIYLSKFLNNMLYIYDDVLNLLVNNEVKYFNEYENELIKIKKLNTIKTIHDKVYIISELINLLIYNPNIKLFIDKLIIKLSGVDNNE